MINITEDTEALIDNLNNQLKKNVLAYNYPSNLLVDNSNFVFY